MKLINRCIEKSERLAKIVENISPFWWVGLFLLSAVGLTYYRAAPYGGNPSALISLQKAFLDVNPGASFPGLVVLRDSGYDGQFFYLIARYLFDPGMPLPIMDTYTMRMGRIGMSLLTGLPAALLGWPSYPIVTLCVLNAAFLASFFALRAMLPAGRRFLALVYLFSPFSLNSTLLLVSDSLMVSVAILALFLLERGQFRLSDDRRDTTDFRSPATWGAVLLMVFLVLVRDTALFFLAPIGLLFLWRRSFRGMILVALPVLFYIAWTLFVKSTEINPGTNPVHYGSRWTLPVRGFVESLVFSGDLSLRSLARETSKLLNFVYVLLLVFAMRRIRSVPAAILSLPLAFAAALSLVAVKEYWETFDNVSRMFALTLPWTILLRERVSGFRARSVLTFSVFLFLLLCLRIIWLKTALPFDIMGG